MLITSENDVKVEAAEQKLDTPSQDIIKAFLAEGTGLGYFRVLFQSCHFVHLVLLLMNEI